MDIELITNLRQLRCEHPRKAASSNYVNIKRGFEVQGHHILH
jgi:hypothetical protein